MNDPDLDKGLDQSMDERLTRFARSSREPALPEEVADLPWTVQLEPIRTSRLGWLSGAWSGAGGIRRAGFAFARLGLTLAVAGSFLLLVGQVRTGGTGSDLIQLEPTPRASVSVGPTSGPEVVVLPTSGVVDDVMASYIAEGVRRAESDGAAAVIVQLDTLGGSEDAMLRIDAALHSKVPTIVWVGPSGAKAASAGTFMTLSANLAFMAPSTNIGAASPVAAGGADIAATYGQTEADKVMNDAIATMRSIAQERHPDAVAWAVSTVQNAQSYTAQEALSAKAINGIAGSLDAVLAQVDGAIVTTTSGPVVVHTKDATIVTINEDLVQSFLHTLDDPNIAFMLLVIGVLLVAVEFFHPTLLMGLAGALCLALSFYGSGSLPLNVLGVVLVVLGIGMIVLEPNLPSHGVLTIGGIVVFVVGAVAFYGSPGPFLPTVAVAWPIIGVMTAAAAAYGLILVGTLMRLRRQPLPVGAGLVGFEKVVGLVGEVRRDLAPVGTVYVGREEWSARTRDGGPLGRDAKVRVVGQEGLTLIVERVE
ncbi:MAG: NfeD family protein [Candidatus Limnocylindrales bacterium]|jgi:membrane-bound serine protease (ClpP class)